MAQCLGQDGQPGDDVGQGPQVPPDLLLVGQAEVGEEPDLVPEVLQEGGDGDQDVAGPGDLVLLLAAQPELRVGGELLEGGGQTAEVGEGLVWGGWDRVFPCRELSFLSSY